MRSIFRIDDVSLNTDLAKLNEFVSVALSNGLKQVVLAISPMVYQLSENDHPERVFPSIFNAHSTEASFLAVSNLGIPLLEYTEESVIHASHGLIHMDHRLLHKEAQRLSIVTSCSLIDSALFVPPFNKINRDTIDVCNEHNVTLIRFEDGWKHVRYNPFTGPDGLYYVHTHDMTLDELKDWFRHQ